MKEKDKTKDKCRHAERKIPENSALITAVALSLIIAIQIGYIGYLFFFEKTTYHCDEVYSYGLSNNFSGAYLESENVYTEDGYNINQWVSGKLFHDYITVQSDQRFRYDVVWRNQSQDRHPPLFYACIHTICSFMPEQFSFVFGFALNIVCFALIQVFLFLLAKELLRSRYIALLLTLMWGFSAGAVNNTLFVRMYCMMTMWTVILYWLHARLYKAGEKPKAGIFVALGVITMLGGLTQYLFYLPAFIIAVSFCIYYLINKRFRLFFIYSVSMIAGVAAAFLIYLPSYRQLFNEGDHAQGCDLSLQIPISLRYISKDVFSLIESDAVYFLKIGLTFLVTAVIFSLPLLFLFRKNEKLKAFFSAVREKIRSSAGRLRNFSIKKAAKSVKSADPIPAAIFLSLAAAVLLVSYTVPFVLGFCNRYFFFLLPLAALLAMFVLKCIFGKGRVGKIVLSAFTLFIVFHTVFAMPLSGIWTAENDIDLRGMIKDSDVGLISNYDSYSQLSVFSYELAGTRSVFFTNLDDIEKHADAVSACETRDPLFVLVYFDDYDKDKKGDYVREIIFPKKRYYIEDILAPFTKIKGHSSYEYIGDYTIVTGKYRIYRIT